KGVHIVTPERHYPLFVATVLLKAQTVIECGTGPGNSLETFIKALKLTGGKVYTWDINSKWEEKFRSRKMKAEDPADSLVTDYENYVIFHVSDSIEAGHKWDKGDIDILYCDANHGYKHVTHELEAWGKFNPKIIFIHDTGGPGTKMVLGHPFRAAMEYAEKTGRNFFNLLTPQGLGVII
ncbi:unnamed protein product, partial [marine sediment metagenome]